MVKSASRMVLEYGGLSSSTMVEVVMDLVILFMIVAVFYVVILCLWPPAKKLMIPVHLIYALPAIEQRAMPIGLNDSIIGH